jgi:hypothetical protein
VSFLGLSAIALLALILLWTTVPETLIDSKTPTPAPPTPAPVA